MKIIVVGLSYAHQGLNVVLWLSSVFMLGAEEFRSCIEIRQLFRITCLKVQKKNILKDLNKSIC